MDIREIRKYIIMILVLFFCVFIVFPLGSKVYGLSDLVQRSTAGTAIESIEVAYCST